MLGDERQAAEEEVGARVQTPLFYKARSPEKLKSDEKLNSDDKRDTADDKGTQQNTGVENTLPGQIQ